MGVRVVRNMFDDYQGYLQRVDIMMRHMVAAGNQRRAVDTTLLIGAEGSVGFLVPSAVPLWMSSGYDVHAVLSALLGGGVWLAVAACRRVCCGRRTVQRREKQE